MTVFPSCMESKTRRLWFPCHPADERNRTKPSQKAPKGVPWNTMSNPAHLQTQGGGNSVCSSAGTAASVPREPPRAVPCRGTNQAHPVTTSHNPGTTWHNPGTNPAHPATTWHKPDTNPTQTRHKPGTNPGTNPAQARHKPGTNPAQPGTNPAHPGINPAQTRHNPGLPMGNVVAPFPGAPVGPSPQALP